MKRSRSILDQFKISVESPPLKTRGKQGPGWMDDDGMDGGMDGQWRDGWMMEGWRDEWGDEWRDGWMNGGMDG